MIVNIFELDDDMFLCEFWEFFDYCGDDCLIFFKIGFWFDLGL